MDKNGNIVKRPAGMSDEEWSAKLKELGLVELKGIDAQRLEALATGQREQMIPAFRNRRERRAIASRARRK